MKFLVALVALVGCLITKCTSEARALNIGLGGSNFLGSAHVGLKSGRGPEGYGMQFSTGFQSPFFSKKEDKMLVHEYHPLEYSAYNIPRMQPMMEYVPPYNYYNNYYYPEYYPPTQGPYAYCPPMCCDMDYYPPNPEPKITNSGPTSTMSPLSATSPPPMIRDAYGYYKSYTPLGYRIL